MAIIGYVPRSTRERRERFRGCSNSSARGGFSFKMGIAFRRERRRWEIARSLASSRFPDVDEQFHASFPFRSIEING